MAEKPTNETPAESTEEAEVEGFAVFAKYEGVDGESQDRGHAGWSDLASFGQSIHKPGAGALQLDPIRNFGF